FGRARAARRACATDRGGHPPSRGDETRFTSLAIGRGEDDAGDMGNIAAGCLAACKRGGMANREKVDRVVARSCSGGADGLVVSAVGRGGAGRLLVSSVCVVGSSTAAEGKRAGLRRFRAWVRN